MTTLIQYKASVNSVYGGTGAGANFALDSAATTGNAICATVMMDPGVSVTSVTDSNGVALTLNKTAETNQQANENIYFYSIQSVSGTPTGINVKTATDTTISVWMEEVSGMASASIVDVNPAKATGGYNTTPTMSLTTTTDSVYTRALMSYGGGRTITPGAGYTANNTASVSKHGVFNVNVGTAGSKTVDATISSAENWAVSAIGYKTGATGPTVTSVTQTSGGTEGSPAVMTVALSGATSGSTNFAATLAGVTATGSGTDFTSDLASATYSNGVTFSGGNMVVPDAVSGWTVTISTTGDTLDEANETATLTVGGTAGTLTITDDDAAPTITGTASSTVTAGDPVVITYSPGLSGQTRTYTLALTDGTAVGGTDYDNTTVTGDFAVTAGTGSVSISGSTVTVDPGVTEFTLSIGTTA